MRKPKENDQRRTRKLQQAPDDKHYKNKTKQNEHKKKSNGSPHIENNLAYLSSCLI